MRTSLQDGISCRRACFTERHVLEEATLIAYLFNICCRCNQRSFLVSKCSLCVNLVDIPCKHD